MAIEDCEALPAGLTMVVPKNALLTAAMIGVGWLEACQTAADGKRARHEGAWLDAQQVLQHFVDKYATPIATVFQTLNENGFPSSVDKCDYEVTRPFAHHHFGEAFWRGRLPERAEVVASVITSCRPVWPDVAPLGAIVREAFREDC